MTKLSEYIKLKRRCAQALGWEDFDVDSMSLQALRELVRPRNPKLAAELTEVINSGRVVTRPA